MATKFHRPLTCSKTYHFILIEYPRFLWGIGSRIRGPFTKWCENIFQKHTQYKRTRAICGKLGVRLTRDLLRDCFRTCERRRRRELSECVCVCCSSWVCCALMYICVSYVKCCLADARVFEAGASVIITKCSRRASLLYSVVYSYIYICIS